MTVETNVTCEEYELPLEQNEFLKEYEWWMEMLGNLPIGIAGVFLNSVALLVLSTSSMRGHFFNRLWYTKCRGMLNWPFFCTFSDC